MAPDNGLLTIRSVLHPSLEILIDEAPVLANLGRWNDSQPGKFVDRRFRNPQKVRHFFYG
jgi:hypothetical protein